MVCEIESSSLSLEGIVRRIEGSCLKEASRMERGWRDQSGTYLAGLVLQVLLTSLLSLVATGHDGDG